MLGLYTTTQYRALESQYKKAEKLIKELQEKIEDLKLKSESSQLLVDYNELKIAHQALVSKEAIESKTIEALDSIVQDHKTKMASLKPESSSTTPSVIESKAKITDVAREVNKYRDEIKSLQDKVIALGKERDDAMLEAQAILMEELPVMPIYYYTNAILMRSTVKNAPKSITGPVNYREAYLEK